MKSLNYIFTVLIIFCFLSCNSANTDGTLTINYNELCQQIDGFGGSNAWTRLPDNPETAEEIVRLLYSRTEGVGFTILRNRIPFRERLPGDTSPGFNDGFVERNSDHTYKYTVNENGTKTFSLNWNAWDIAGTKKLIEKIQALGEDGPENLTIMSTPWTMPNNRVTQWKENVTGVSSRLNYEIDWARPDVWGRLKRNHYEDYADLLADYALNFERNMGAALNILSIQNEPNYKTEYESAYWSGEDLRDFLKVIGTRFPLKGIAVGANAGENALGIMAPEYENFDIRFNDMIKPMLDDPLSERILTHIALHQYNAGYDSSVRAGSREFPGITASGKRFWQTEISGSGPNYPRDNGIDNALYFARMIHFDMTITKINAFLYWWLWENNSQDPLFPGSLLMTDGYNIKDSLRLYAMGQYSRFIRPGWYRINCVSTPVKGRAVYATSYKNPDSNEIAIVIINDTIEKYNIALDLDGAHFTRLDIFRTSTEEKLKPAGRQRVSGNTANIKLPPRSITTYYGIVN